MEQVAYDIKLSYKLWQSIKKMQSFLHKLIQPPLNVCVQIYIYAYMCISMNTAEKFLFCKIFLYTEEITTEFTEALFNVTTMTAVNLSNIQTISVITIPD